MKLVKSKSRNGLDGDRLRQNIENFVVKKKKKQTFSCVLTALKMKLKS